MNARLWILSALSFAVMFSATGYVLAANWPDEGMPLLAWQSHAAALVTVCVEVMTRALKIQASARAIEAPIAFGTALRVCLAGDFAAAVTPARSGAEPARFLVLAESGVSAAARIVILFLELFLEMWSLVLVCLVLAILFHGQGASVYGLMGLVGGYSATVLGVGAAGLLLAKRRAHGPPPEWASTMGINAGRWRALQRTLRQLRDSVQRTRSAHRGYMALALGGSILHVVCKVATLPVLVYFGTAELPLTMQSLAPLVLWPLALFYGGVVMPAPGGGGFIEGAFTLTLGDAIPSAIFAASLLWWRFYTFYLYLIIGALASGNAVMRALRGTSAPSSGAATNVSQSTNP